MSNTSTVLCKQNSESLLADLQWSYDGVCGHGGGQVGRQPQQVEHHDDANDASTGFVDVEVD